MSYDTENIIERKIAPVLYDFVEWVIASAEKDGISNLYFMARDAYIFHKIAKSICKHKNINLICEYLYVSRRSLLFPSFIDKHEDALDYIFSVTSSVTIKTIFDRALFSDEQRQSILKESMLEISEHQSVTHSQLYGIRQKLCSNENFIYILKQNIENSYFNTISYLNQEGLTSYNKIGVVDSGWTGRTQSRLYSLVKKVNTDTNIYGYYFGLLKTPPKVQGCMYSSWYLRPHGNISRKSKFNNNVFEVICSAPHGSTIGYEITPQKVLPLLESNIILKRNMDSIRHFNKSIESYVITRLSISYKPHDNYMKHFLKFMFNPDRDDIALLQDFYFSDDVVESYSWKIVSEFNKAELSHQLLHRKILSYFKKHDRIINNPILWEYGTLNNSKNIMFKFIYRYNFFIWNCIRFILHKN